MFKIPKNDRDFIWTSHAGMKMNYYGLSESLIKRIIRFPERTEEGIAPKTIAVMQKAKTKRPQEVWVMVQKTAEKNKREKGSENKLAEFLGTKPKFKIISVWRYPGITKPRGQEALGFLSKEYSDFLQTK